MKRIAKSKPLAVGSPLPPCLTCKQRRFCIDRAGLVRCTVCFAPQHPIVDAGTLAEFVPFLIAQQNRYREMTGAVASAKAPVYTAPKRKAPTPRRKG